MFKKFSSKTYLHAANQVQKNFIMVSRDFQFFLLAKYGTDGAAKRTAKFYKTFSTFLQNFDEIVKFNSLFTLSLIISAIIVMIRTYSQNSMLDVFSSERR